MTGRNEEVVAALRVWCDAPNLMISYERRGITIGTLALRTEAARAAVAKCNEMLYSVAGTGDPEMLETLSELFDMAREALNGGPGQVLPLTGGAASPLDNLFGEVS